MDTAGDDEEGRRKQEEADGGEEGRRAEGKAEGGKKRKGRGKVVFLNQTAAEESEGGAKQGMLQLGSNGNDGVNPAAQMSGAEGSRAIWEEAASLGMRLL